MHVRIDRAIEKRGMLFKKELQVIYLTLEFSHEEKAILKQADLENAVFYTRPTPPGEPHRTAAAIITSRVSVKALLPGQRVEMGAFNTASHASNAEDEIQKACKQLKTAMENSKGPITGTKSYDL